MTDANNDLKMGFGYRSRCFWDNYSMSKCFILMILYVVTGYLRID